MEVRSGEEKEWVIKMVGEQFYLYTIKVIIIMMMTMMITMLMNITVVTIFDDDIYAQVECEGWTLASYEVAIGRGAQDSTLAVVFQRVTTLIF